MLFLSLTVMQSNATASVETSNCPVKKKELILRRNMLLAKYVEQTGQKKVPGTLLLAKYVEQTGQKKVPGTLDIDNTTKLSEERQQMTLYIQLGVSTGLSVMTFLTT